MNTHSMTISHQNTAPWQWLLGQGEVTRIERTEHARWVHVTEGRVWLTRSGAGPDEADVWLQAGQRQVLVLEIEPAIALFQEFLLLAGPQSVLDLALFVAQRLPVLARHRDLLRTEGLRIGDRDEYYDPCF